MHGEFVFESGTVIFIEIGVDDSCFEQLVKGLSIVAKSLQLLCLRLLGGLLERKKRIWLRLG